ncbi:MAG: flagellar protein FlgN [Clostridia bacterium]|nr:flagellar protein FlgN [Clostridia bacterium]
MEPMFKDLISILDEQKTVYSQLLDLSQQKQKHLIKGDINSLNVVTKQEEVIIFKAGKLEEKRIACFKLLAEKYGFDEGTNLQDVISKVPDDVGSVLKEICKEFPQILDKLRELNKENTRLIQQSLQFVNVTVDVINHQAKPTYNADKEVEIEKISKLFDRKV